MTLNACKLYKLQLFIWACFDNFDCLHQMKLEKERSSSMDKILNKLGSAQKKAEAMRSAVKGTEAHQRGRTNRKTSFFMRFVHMSFLVSCFTCHAS